MDSDGVLGRNTENLLKALKSISVADSELIELLGREIAKAINLEGAIFWCGNGGSAAESQHMAAELMGRFKFNRRPYRSISLTTDTSVITGISNDFDFSEIFSRQILGLSNKGDFLIVFSTSGKSKNITNALKTAKKIGLTSIAFLGGDGGYAKEIANFSFIVNSSETARIQEVHTLMAHSLCEIIESQLEKTNKSF